MDRTTPRIGLLLAALLCSAAAAADTANLYRWVDKDGRVHYGDQPGANAQRLNPKTLNSADDEGGSSGGAADAAATKQAAQCKQKSEQLTTYQKAASVTETDALGNQHEYTPDEKDQLVAKTQKYLDDHCASTANAR